MRKILKNLFRIEEEKCYEVFDKCDQDEWTEGITFFYDQEDHKWYAIFRRATTFGFEECAFSVSKNLALDLNEAVYNS